MSSLDGLVAETGRVLSDARRLFGAAPVEGALPSAQQLMAGRAAVAHVGQAAAANWQGEVATTYAATNADQVHALDRTIAADGQVNPALTHAGQAAAVGARSIDDLISHTRAGVSALAPSTRSAAGQQQLASFLRGQLNQAKGLLQNFQQRNAEIAGTIQNADYGRLSR